MLEGTLRAGLLANLLTGLRTIATSQGWGTIRVVEGKITAGEGTIRAD